MAWIKTPNVAEFKGANWDNFVKTVPKSNPEQAKRIALQNPNISFFFFCREYMVLEGRGTFNPGDAVFFTGEPWYGSAPQCDAYQKDHMTVVYINPKASQPLEAVGCYTLADGSPAVDVACIFAANINWSQSPYISYNYNIMDALTGGAVKKLQDLGITVLLTILGNHLDAGWSCFSTEVAAKAYADYLISDVVQKYGLDGIDIDDEYSACTTNDKSLVWVTEYMNQAKPDSIVSKALYADIQYFSYKFNGKTLADTIMYGWEMTYGGNPNTRLTPYVNAGMAKNKLSLGVWSGAGSPGQTAEFTKWVNDNGYEGMMVYAFEEEANRAFAEIIDNTFYGPGNWKSKPDCLPG